MILLDHVSSADMRPLADQNLSVIRIESGPYEGRSAYINFIIDSWDIRKRFDWVFVLDIDEFLSVSDQGELEDVLQRNSGALAISLPWRNGLPFGDRHQPSAPRQDNASNLGDQRLRFYSEPSRYRKLATNARQGIWFHVRGGAHYLKLDPWSRFRTKIHTRGVKNSRLELLHVPFLDFGTLADKLAMGPDWEFRDKLFQTEARVDMYQSLKERPSDEESWAYLKWLCAYYRAGPKMPFARIPDENFLSHPVFEALPSRRIAELGEQVKALLPTPRHGGGTNSENWESAWLGRMHRAEQQWRPNYRGLLALRSGNILALSR